METTPPLSRTAIINGITAESPDIAIIGGGIHGAALARLAAASGLRTVLLEKGDYVSGTSSRSSKMAHGGLRYLEMGDFKQVFEGIKAREALFENYPHLVKPYPFLIPVPKGKYFFKYKLRLGLSLYDLMVRRSERKHRWIPKSELDSSFFCQKRDEVMGCFQYTDGILSDSRLVFEALYGARQYGALCLNYAKVVRVNSRSNENVVDWVDTRSEREYQCRPKLVVNVAGPWAPYLQPDYRAGTVVPVRYSRGTHLLFSKKWTGPALFLPLEGKARYYFVWPHFSGTMVGTTEREVFDDFDEPIPSEDEIEEILHRVQKDLAGSGLSRDNLHYAFSGIRTLPLRSKNSSTAEVSRRHVWNFKSGMLTLLGGKYTTAEWTAWEGLQEIQVHLGRTSEAKSIQYQWGAEAEFHSWMKRAKEIGLSSFLQAELIRRYGQRVPVAVDLESQCFGGLCYASELDYAIRHEQAETVSDIFRRRLEIEYLPNGGLEVLEEVLMYLMKTCEREAESFESVEYREHVERIQGLVGFDGLVGDISE